jgi:glyoxylase-like metal-dependent hydrolase (beta-lactamase superfamily II)
MPAPEPQRPGRPVHYEVLAIRYGRLRAPKSELFYRYSSYREADAEVEMAFYFWVLRAGDETLLVDCGFDPAAAARRGRECLIPPLEALSRAGIEPEAVSTIIVTHLHYDHIGNLAAFPHAGLIVGRRELEFWTSPAARRFQFAVHVEEEEIERVNQAHRDGRVRLTDGAEEILDGITVHTVGGHSPGQQVCSIATAGGSVVLASDAVHFYEEFELGRPFSTIADLAQMYEAYDLLTELAAGPGAVMVPGHDPAVLDRFPALDPEYAGVVARVG